ncbi:hypothetical protein BAC1_00879 [uncultured bacterium]|nr:hypothetical protein BAC1_00879 [uncultured bacterium]
MAFLKTFKKTVKWFSLAFTAVSFIVMLTPLSNRLAAPLLVSEGPAQKTDVIAVLGGGAYANGVLGGASNERLIKGVLLYREGRAPKIVFTGGSVLELKAKLNHTVLGSVDAAAGKFTEAGLMRDIVTGMGVPSTDCIVEDKSLSTFENLRNLKAYMDGNGLLTATIVSSPLHMKRTELIARKLGLEFTLSPAFDATMHRTTPIARIHLMRDVLWEYAALGLYWMRGQV